MVDILSMVDLTSISAILAAIGVLVGVVFAILELRDLVKARQTALIIELYSTLDSKEFMGAWKETLTEIHDFKDFNDYVKKHGTGSFQVGLFFEQLGVLLHRKLIDIGLVDDLFTSPVNLTWEKIKPIAEKLREQGIPTAWEWFEYLYNEMQKREQQLTTIQ